jgi:hypothetical protein
LPVGQREYLFPADEVLLSVTDLEDRLTYRDPAFVATSGCSREELPGQPHKLIRHPDMPEVAFRDPWATVQAGLPWTGVVKNRRPPSWLNQQPTRPGHSIRHERTACAGCSWPSPRDHAVSGRTPAHGGCDGRRPLSPPPQWRCRA